MVRFNEVDLESIGKEIRIIDVNVSAPSILPTIINPDLIDGALFSRSNYGERTVTVTFVIMTDDKARRSELFRELYLWADIKSTHSLVVPQEPDGYLDAVCTSLPDASSASYWDQLELVFTAYDPYFHSFNENQSVIGSDFTITRHDCLDWRIEFSVPNQIQYPAWRHNSGKEIAFSTMQAGDLVIDSKTQTAYIDDLSALPNLMLGSRFFTLPNGNNRIIPINGAGGYITWRERWL